MRKEYCSKLTKQDLIKMGITNVTEDGIVYGLDNISKSYTINKQGYLTINLYELDSDGNRIKMPIKRYFNRSKVPTNTYIYKSRVFSLNRIMWAWFYGEVPAGYVVDHINNKHTKLEDYKLENLQLLTPAENIAKEKSESNRLMKCNLKKPLDEYINKLEDWLLIYDNAKKEHDANKVHMARSMVAHCKAQIRYWLKYNTVENAMHEWFKNKVSYEEALIKYAKIKEYTK